MHDWSAHGSREILVLVEHGVRASVVSELGPRFQPRFFEEWIGFRRAVPASGGAVLLVDPSSLRPRAFEDLLDQVGSRSQATIWYTAGYDHRLIQAALRGWGELFVYGAQRQGPPLHKIASFAHSGTAAGLFFEEIASNLNELPLRIRSPLIPMLGGAVIPATVSELATQCGLARRSLDRMIQRAGFVSTKRLLTCIQLASAWVAARSSDLTSFAGWSGIYDSPRTIEAHCRAVIGMGSRVALATLSDRNVAAKLACYSTVAPSNWREIAI